MSAEIYVIAHNIRSAHNVGSILRTAEGFGVKKVFLTGYTPYPKLASGDPRLPHIAEKLDNQIQKSSLNAQHTVDWQHADDIFEIITSLRNMGIQIIGLEQTPHSIALPDFDVPPKVAILLGEEVSGINDALLDLCDQTVEIPMLGAKESFNVSVATAICLYRFRFG